MTTPRLSNESTKDLLGWAGAFLIGCVAGIMPLIPWKYFYYNDDGQNQFFPYYIDIGQHLHQGQWPGLSLSTFYGGNLIDDWQYAMFNPVSLLWYWLIAPIHHYLVLTALFCGFYLISIALGGYGLGRTFGLGRILALVLALLLSTNNFLQYFYADSWIPGLVSFSWFVWAWGGLERYRQRLDRGSLAWVAVLVYLTVSSGYPHTILMLGVVVAGYLVEIAFLENGVAKGVSLVAAVVGAGLVMAPAMLPAFLSFSWMIRPSGIHNWGTLGLSLGEVLNLSQIYYLPRVQLFSHWFPNYSLTYLAWFIVPLAPLLSGRRLLDALEGRWSIILLFCASSVVLFGPEVLGPIRFPIRFMPFVHLSLLVAFLRALSMPGIFVVNRTRLLIVAGVLFLQAAQAVATCPDFIVRELLSGVVSAILVVATIKLVRAENSRAWSLLLLGGSLLVFCCMHLVSPLNEDLPDYHATPFSQATSPTVAKPFTGYDLYIGPKCYDDLQEIHMAAQGIYYGTYTINGYSALQHVALNPPLKAAEWLDMPDVSAVNFFAGMDSDLNSSMLDLMRVNRLVIYNEYLPAFEASEESSKWSGVARGKYATTFERVRPNMQQTTLSYASPGIQADPIGLPTGECERLHISGVAAEGRLVFARLWWPGYKAYLGDQELVTVPRDKIFVEVDLPAFSSGDVTLRFDPPGFNAGICLALVGMAAVGWALWANGRLKERQWRDLFRFVAPGSSSPPPE